MCAGERACPGQFPCPSPTVCRRERVCKCVHLYVSVYVRVCVPGLLTCVLVGMYMCASMCMQLEIHPAQGVLDHRGTSRDFLELVCATHPASACK